MEVRRNDHTAPHKLCEEWLCIHKLLFATKNITACYKSIKSTDFFFISWFCKLILWYVILLNTISSFKAKIQKVTVGMMNSGNIIVILYFLYIHLQHESVGFGDLDTLSYGQKCIFDEKEKVDNMYKLIVVW